MRIQKEYERTHFSEVVERFELIDQATALLLSVEQQLKSKIFEIQKHGYTDNIVDFMLGTLTKCLYSCLIDADRLDKDSCAAIEVRLIAPSQLPFKYFYITAGNCQAVGASGDGRVCLSASILSM